MSEQRISPRRRVSKAATIAFNGSGINCLVRNLSADGAALEVETHAAIPAEFGLVISAERFSEFCRVLWRETTHLGVAFQPRPSADVAAPLVPRLSTVQTPHPDRPIQGLIEPIDPTSPAFFRSQDTLPEHPGPPLAPDYSELAPVTAHPPGSYRRLFPRS